MGATKNVSKIEPEVTVTLYVRDLNDPDFYAVLTKLDASTGVLSAKKAWSFADFKGLCDAQQKKARDLYQRLLAEHVETECILQPNEDGLMVPALDEHGQEIRRLKVIRDNDGKIKGYVYKDQTGFTRAYEELMELNFEAQLILFTSDELSLIGASPKELRAFRKLIVDAPK